MIWEQSFQLYRHIYLKKEVITLLKNYTESRHKVTVSDIVAEDAKMILPFIDSEMDPDNFFHCLVIQNYLDLLEDHQVSFSRGLRNRYMSEVYVLSKLLKNDWPNKQYPRMSYEEYQKRRQNRMKKYFAGFTLTDYEAVFPTMP